MRIGMSMPVKTDTKSSSSARPRYMMTVLVFAVCLPL